MALESEEDSGGYLREDSRTCSSEVVEEGGLTGWEPLASGRNSQTSRWMVLVVSDLSAQWPFRMYWLKDRLQRCPDAIEQDGSWSLGAF